MSHDISLNCIHYFSMRSSMNQQKLEGSSPTTPGWGPAVLTGARSLGWQRHWRLPRLPGSDQSHVAGTWGIPLHQSSWRPWLSIETFEYIWNLWWLGVPPLLWKPPYSLGFMDLRSPKYWSILVWVCHGLSNIGGNQEKRMLVEWKMLRIQNVDMKIREPDKMVA